MPCILSSKYAIIIGFGVKNNLQACRYDINISDLDVSKQRRVKFSIIYLWKKKIDHLS